MAKYFGGSTPAEIGKAFGQIGFNGMANSLGMSSWRRRRRCRGHPLPPRRLLRRRPLVWRRLRRVSPRRCAELRSTVLSEVRLGGAPMG